jgi:hypothetical protein
MSGVQCTCDSPADLVPTVHRPWCAQNAPAGPPESLFVALHRPPLPFSRADGIIHAGRQKITTWGWAAWCDGEPVWLLHGGATDITCQGCLDRWAFAEGVTA